MERGLYGAPGSAFKSLAAKYNHLTPRLARRLHLQPSLGAPVENLQALVLCMRIPCAKP